MIWFVKMLWQMPRAMIEYRREYKQVQFVRKVRKQFNEVEAYFIIIEKFKELYDDEEFYLVSLKDMADRDSDLPQSELERFFDKGVELGIFNPRVKIIPKVEAKTPAWKLWEEE